MTKYQARCLCGWKGEWTVNARFARAEGATHSRKFEKTLEEFTHGVLVVPGNGIDYVQS